MKMHSWLARRAWPMLCVTMTIVNFSRRPSIKSSMPSTPRASRAEHGSSIKITCGFSGSNRAMHSFCCCSSVRWVALRRSRSFTSSHKLYVAQGRFHHLVLLAAGELAAMRMDANAEQHVFVDRDGQRIRPLKHHADRFSQRAQRNVGIIDVLCRGWLLRRSWSRCRSAR